MRAFQLLCVSLVVVASVSGAGAATGSCTGIHTTPSKSCDLYDEAECLNAKELGCVWEAATGGSPANDTVKWDTAGSPANDTIKWDTAGSPANDTIKWDTAPSPKMEGGAGEKEAPSPGGSPADDTKWDTAPSPKMEGGAGDATGYCDGPKEYCTSNNNDPNWTPYNKCLAQAKMGCKWIESPKTDPVKGEGRLPQNKTMHHPTESTLPR